MTTTPSCSGRCFLTRKPARSYQARVASESSAGALPDGGSEAASELSIFFGPSTVRFGCSLSMQRMLPRASLLTS